MLMAHSDSGQFEKDGSVPQLLFVNAERRNTIRRGEVHNFEHMQLLHLSSETGSN